MKQFLSILLLIAAANVSHAQNRIDVVNPALTATTEGRQQLKYLASCALNEETILQAVHDGEKFEFPGAMALAPDWQDKPLTETERRWVSACILARTNAFGAHVLISMRSPLGIHEALNVSSKELQSHTIYEGGYFGDIFGENAEAYVCIGADHATNIAARERRKRVCTHDRLDGAPGTRCGFISVGVCPEGTPPVANGKEWTEVIHVWLAAAEPAPD